MKLNTALLLATIVPATPLVARAQADDVGMPGKPVDPEPAHVRNADRRSIRDWNAVCDGVADDSAVMARAASDTRDTGTRIEIPADCKINMGGTAQVWMRGMAFEGDGVRDYGPAMGRHGGLILVTDPARSPFLVSNSWGMRGLELYWPKQVPLQPGTEPLKYPPLIIPHDEDEVIFADFSDNQVVNAYDLMDLRRSVNAGHFRVQDNSIYALHYAFNFQSVGGETWITDNQFSPIAWHPVIAQGPNNPTIAWSVANSEAIRVTGNGSPGKDSTYTVDGLVSAHNYFLLFNSALHVFGGRADLLQWDGNGLDGLPNPILVDGGGSLEGSITGGQVNQAWPGNHAHTGCAINIAPGAGPNNGLSLTGVDFTGALGSAFCVTDVGNSQFSLTGGAIWNLGLTTTKGAYPAISFNSRGTLSVIGVQMRNTVVSNRSASIVVQSAAAVAIAGNTMNGWTSALQMNGGVGASTFVANAIIGTQAGGASMITGPGAGSVTSLGNATR